MSRHDPSETSATASDPRSSGAAGSADGWDAARLRTLAFFGVALVVLVGAIGGIVIGSVGGDESADDRIPDVPTYDPEPPTESGTATVDDRTYDDLAAALDAAEPGDEVILEGAFEPDDAVVVETPDVTLRAADPEAAVIEGGGEGTVLEIDAPNVTVESLWLRDSGHDPGNEDAGIFVNGTGATVEGAYVSDVTYGIWVDGVDDVTLAENRIEGREDVYPMTQRGNGIHLWQTEDTLVRDNEITTVRDGIYYSWATNVHAEGNVLWDLRFGVHYMYSDDNRLADNVAFGNDVGYALMVSEGLTIENNTAVANRGESGHGIMLKDIEDTTIRANALVDNDRGLYVFNAQGNRIVDNALADNTVGVHWTAGSHGLVAANSVVDNEFQVTTTTKRELVWTSTEGGNYWSDARTADLTGDGLSDLRHRPAGAVESLVAERPALGIYTDSPAFEAVRLAEDSFPAVEVPGVVDDRPLVDTPHAVERTEPVDRLPTGPGEPPAILGDTLASTEHDLDVDAEALEPIDDGAEDGAGHADDGHEHDEDPHEHEEHEHSDDSHDHGDHGGQDHGEHQTNDHDHHADDQDHDMEDHDHADHDH